jgi:hypothetical protein
VDRRHRAPPPLGALRPLQRARVRRRIGRKRVDGARRDRQRRSQNQRRQRRHRMRSEAEIVPARNRDDPRASTSPLARDRSDQGNNVVIA